MNRPGCCVDQSCTEATCMCLPKGKTCAHCRYVYRCVNVFGKTTLDTVCDWFPRRFIEVADFFSCRLCGQRVEEAREIYAIPVCYRCLPPPDSLPVCTLKET